jgi:hypothetical protein
MDSDYNSQDHLSLRYGTLKEWHLHSEKGKSLLREYFSLGASYGCLFQKDTLEQKKLICQMIDECNADEIFLDFDGKYISKEEAKEYVMSYKTKKNTPVQ